MTRLIVCASIMFMCVTSAHAADHNDPNSINSIFADVSVSAADLYDMFGWPSSDGENVILALTFASVPATGVFDTDMLYRVKIVPNPRVPRWTDDWSLDQFLTYTEAVKDKYLHLNGAEVRVTVDQARCSSSPSTSSSG